MYRLSVFWSYPDGDGLTYICEVEANGPSECYDYALELFPGSGYSFSSPEPVNVIEITRNAI